MSVEVFAQAVQATRNKFAQDVLGGMDTFRFIKSEDRGSQEKIRRAIYGHVHKQNGMACYYCGYEMES